jgi:hypothetical protein
MNRKLLPSLRAAGAGTASERLIAEPTVQVKTRERQEIPCDHGSSRVRPAI